MTPVLSDVLSAIFAGCYSVYTLTYTYIPTAVIKLTTEIRYLSRSSLYGILEMEENSTDVRLQSTACVLIIKIQVRCLTRKICRGHTVVELAGAETTFSVNTLVEADRQ